MALLTARRVDSLKTPGRHHVGHNLYLRVSAGRGRSYSVLIVIPGVGRREIAVGSTRVVTLAEARRRAEAIRVDVANGIDPRRKRPAAIVTLGQFAERIIAERSRSWRSPRTRGHWEASLRDHAAPLLAMPITAITTEDILRILRPVWGTPETGTKLANRLEVLFDAAAAAGYRTGANPAAWRTTLRHLLPRAHRERRHHAAAPVAELPTLVTTLLARGESVADCLVFLIMTAGRSAEARLMCWSELDLENKIWNLPAARAKTGKASRIPLAAPALGILRRQKRTGDGYVFTGSKPGRPIAASSLVRVLRSLGRTETVHGARSSFRDWCAEHGTFAREAVEMCLGHAIGSRVETAYRRTDLLEARRHILDAWAVYLTNATADILPLRRTQP